MRKNMFYSLTSNENEATINIYGDICSWAWEELGEMSAVNLSKKLEEIGDVSRINVYINSYGGEVAEGLAIYNALKRHKAEIVTYCDGFACSIASVIFMAGDVRIMNDASLLMIHNAWTYAQGNSQELRKQADDLEKITQASVEAYKEHATISEKEIKKLMDNETWLLPEEALEYGFATAIGVGDETENACQCAKASLINLVRQKKAEQEDDDTMDDDTDGETPDDTTDDNATTDDTTDDDTDDANENTDCNKDDEKDTEEKNAAEKWSGFFNALLKN